MENYVEPTVIIAILVLNAIVGVWQETDAENALEALRDMQPDYAKVLRDGVLISDLPSRELVPGDVVELRVGDKASRIEASAGRPFRVLFWPDGCPPRRFLATPTPFRSFPPRSQVPADMRVVKLHTATLRMEQASLTGESDAVPKDVAPLEDPKAEVQSKDNMVFAGTSVANGSCLGVVTHIGMATEIGKVQAQMAAASAVSAVTPLQHKVPGRLPLTLSRRPAIGLVNLCAGRPETRAHGWPCPGLRLSPYLSDLPGTSSSPRLPPCGPLVLLSAGRVRPQAHAHHRLRVRGRLAHELQGVRHVGEPRRQ